MCMQWIDYNAISYSWLYIGEIFKESSATEYLALNTSKWLELHNYVQYHSDTTISIALYVTYLFLL